MHHFNSNSNVKIVDTSLVNKILEQGQKLRNAMVGSILENDPFNTDIIYSKHFNTPKTSFHDLDDIKSIHHVTNIDEKRVEAYIKGEYMTKDEEKLALDTLRSMSAPDLCKTAERTLISTCSGSCKCYICEVYNSNNLYCDLKRKSEVVDSSRPYYFSNEITRDIQEKYRNENHNLLKYVDSLKVSINNLTLNETGFRKVLQNEKRVPYNFSETYFLEYCVPDSIANKSIVSKSKVNSGLENNHVRFCSRRNNDLINFKQISIHNIKNLEKCNLDECDIKFKISYRTQKEKKASILGFAKFNLGYFLLSKSLICNRNLSVFLNEDSPIIVGNLKVSLSLGCGRLYFGQEFIDAIHSVNGNSVVLDSDDSTNQLNREEPNYNVSKEANTVEKQTYQNKHEENSELKESEPKKYKFSNVHSKIRDTSDSFPKSVVSTSTKHTRRTEKPLQTNVIENSNKEIDRTVDKSNKDEHAGVSSVNNTVLKPQISENEKQILFGFLYISEAQYLVPPINTYITCRPFCRSETSCSKLVTDSSNPIFNLSQLVPLIYEDDLLQLLRENYMVIEFWKKIESTDLVFGVTKIPLHQFYLAYRNPVFVKYLSKNKLPIIDTDWWEPIYSIEKQTVLGQVEVLAALGTEGQINTLKSERGFTSGTVKANFSASQPENRRETKLGGKLNIREPLHSFRNEEREKSRDFLQLKRKSNVAGKDAYLYKSGETKDRVVISEPEENNNNSNRLDKVADTTEPPKREAFTLHTEKFDVGTQSNLEMDKIVQNSDKDKISPTQEMLGNFLNQLMAQKQKNICVENSTNTDQVETDRSSLSQSMQDAQNNTNLKLRKTTDLLDSLQKALSLDSPLDSKNSEKKAGTFKASILINSANHLPGRKKCKSKRSRNRSVKNEDNGLPSCYVSFETSENEVKVTPVVVKTTNPTWNHKCEVNLSEDLLTNSQRRLIFKVWRKATNAVSSPNMQTDIVLGFAAVDLTILLAGFPNVKGWFNIIDFTGKCNGQINIHVTPLENLSHYTLREKECSCNTSGEHAKANVKQEEEPSEVFSRALKRKFTELDEITQRLRLRLSKVTNDDSDSSSDGVAEEFERDINTLCIEDDFDLINFEEETNKLSLNSNDKENVARTESSTGKMQSLLTIKEKDGPSEDEDMRVLDDIKISSSNTATSLSQGAGSLLELGNTSDKEKELSALDKHLQEGKQKIDTLLEKLSLISADTNNTFASRYVSGCSLNNDCNAINIDTEAILKELDHSSRPNIQSSLGFEPLRFQQLYGGSCDSNSSKYGGSSVSHTSNSNTSLITDFSDCRPAPDGQGNVLDEKVVKK